MADFNFSDVASKVQPPPQMSLADMVNLARGAQAYQQAQQTNPLALRQQLAETEFSEQQKPLLLRKSGAEANLAESTLQPKIEQAKAESGRALTQLNSEQIDNLRKQIANHSRNLLGLLNTKEPVTPKLLKDFTLDALKNTDASAETIAQELKYLPKSGSDKELRAFIAKHATDALSAEGQLDKLFPSTQFVQTGAYVTPVTGGNPELAHQLPGSVGGVSIEAQLPPTTEIIDPITGQKKLLGTASQRSVNTPLVTGLGTAQQTAQSGLGETVKEDWSTTYKDAQNAPTRIGIFQNIKKLTPESFTGPTAERRQAIASFAQVLGIPLATLESASTDELVKNTKLLQLAGGNTDAARALAEFANPNTKMTKEGINRVTDQLIGMEKMKIAKSNFVQPFAGNAQEYSKKADQFNQIADPRLFQEMKPEDVAKLRKSMSPAEQADLSKKIKLAKELGVL
jgi:hypothetical protein